MSIINLERKRMTKFFSENSAKIEEYKKLRFESYLLLAQYKYDDKILQIRLWKSNRPIK